MLPSYLQVALLAQKASLGKLAVYDESVEVVKILKDLLDDIATRREVLNKVDGSAKKLMDEAMDKMVRLCLDGGRGTGEEQEEGGGRGVGGGGEREV